jgi:hypothetical protein
MFTSPSRSRCLGLVTLAVCAACTFPTEVVVQQPTPATEPATPPGSSSPAESADGGTEPPASTCGPASPAGWSPQWIPPTGAAQGQCEAQDLVDLYAACLGTDATDDTCSSYQSSSPGCASCVLSASTDGSWGPIVVFSDTTIVNQSGCLALVDPAATACAESAQAQTECEHAVCDASCPVSDPASFSAWQQCQAEADQGACAGYDGACLDAALGADAGGASCGGVDFPTAFTNVATVFCGSSG